MLNFKISRLNLIIISLFLALTPIDSHALVFGSLGGSLCGIYNCIMNNGLLAIIATLAIFFLGFNSFFGKTNWGQILTVILGIVIMAGAMGIATTFVGTGSGETCADADIGVAC
jgi:type IV secretory pathway VirB2 component (pilin)